MRTNPAAFALSFGMGLIVLLIGFLALNVGGLVTIAPAEADVEKQLEERSVVYPNRDMVLPDAYVPASPAEATAISEGDVLFKNNCAQCHAVNDKVVGPALAGISKRRSTAWLISWVKNSSKVIASGDAYAVKIVEENGKQQTPSFSQLSDKEIKRIISWVGSHEGDVPSPPTWANAMVTIN